MVDLKYKVTDLYSTEGYLFKSRLNSEYDSIMNSFSQKYKLDEHQKFSSNFFQPNSLYKSILLFHGTGTGKTVTTISIINNINSFSLKLRSSNVRILCPAALKFNWKKELNRFLLEKDTIIKFISTNSSKVLDELDSELKSVNLNETNIFIIDEVHTFLSSLIEEESSKKIVYQSLQEIAFKENVYFILLSATPCINKPEELIYIFNLLRKDCLPNIQLFNQIFINDMNNDIKNPILFSKRITGLVSYFETKEGPSYPKINREILKISMSKLQEESYKVAEEKERGYKNISGYRQITMDACNFIVKKDLMGSYLNNNLDVKKIIEESNLEDLRDMSPKFFDMIDKIKSARRPCCVYFAHVEKGLFIFSYILDKIGFKNYEIIYGKTKYEKREEIMETFNSIDNMYGEKIKLLLITQVFSVGVTIKYLEYLLIDSSWWNISRIKQVEGRAARYDTHTNLPKEERFVNIYIYCMIRNNATSLTSNEVALERALEKENLINKFYNLLRISSIDLDFNKTNKDFLYPYLESIKPNFSFIYEPRQFITKSLFDDFELNLSSLNLNLQKYKVHIIEGITDNNKIPNKYLMYKHDNYKYILLDIKFKTIVGNLQLDTNNYPKISDKYFIINILI